MFAHAVAQLELNLYASTLTGYIFMVKNHKLRDKFSQLFRLKYLQFFPYDTKAKITANLLRVMLNIEYSDLSRRLLSKDSATTIPYGRRL